MGGRIAMRAALLHPERVATLTLLDTHEGFEAFTPQQRRDFVESRRAPVTVLPEAGHLSNIEDAAGFNAVALAWLLPRAALARLNPAQSAAGRQASRTRRVQPPRGPKRAR